MEINFGFRQEISDHEANAKRLQEKIKQLEEACVNNEMEKGEMKLYQSSKEDTLKREIEKLQVLKCPMNDVNLLNLIFFFCTSS